MSVEQLKNHWATLVIAAMSGVIVGLPHLLIPRWIAPSPYDPLQFTYGQGSSITMEEVYTYAPEVREILAGSRFVSDSQVYEYRHSKTPFIGESGDAWIIALLSRLSGSLERGFIVSDFVFPFLTFLTVYFLTLFLSRNKIIAAGVAAIVVLWPELVALIPYPQAMRSSFIDAFRPRDFLIMSRSFHPQVSLPLYFLAVVLVIVAVSKKRWWVSVVAGVVGGFLFYTYVFAWTAFLAGFGLFGITVLVRRKSGVLKHLVLVTVVMSVIALPYVDTARKFQQSGRATDFFQKLSLPKRGFLDLVARHTIFIGLYVLVRRKRWTTEDWCFLAFWIAPLILPNLSQELLGRDLEGKHWIRRLAYPLSTIGLGVVIASVLPKKVLNLGAIALLIVVVSRGVLLQYVMAKQSADTYRIDKEKRELFEWINWNTEPGTVIASLDWEMITSLPAKTHAYNFAPIGMRTIASTVETINRYLWAFAVLGANEETVARAFSDDHFDGQTGIAISRAVYFRYAEPGRVFVFPEQEKAQVLGRFDDIRTRVALGEHPPFRLDYLLVDPDGKEIELLFGERAQERLVFKNDAFELYRYAVLQSGE